MKTDPGNVRIRKARKSDCDFLYSLLDHSPVRTAAFNSKPVTYKEHVKWFRTKISGKEALMLIFELDRMPFAQCRFEKRNKGSEVSVVVDREYRGKGLGTMILKMASEYLETNNKGWLPVIARIKPHNVISLRTFANAGFMNTGKVRYRNHLCFEFKRFRRQESGKDNLRA